MPRRYGRYFEPFVGGGALFFRLRPAEAFLTDINAELVDCYRAVRDRVEEVVAALGGHIYDKDHYYGIRALDPAELELPARAARTIFLNKAGYNGLFRVNRAGRFNVPFGRYTRPTLCDSENLRACAAALQMARLEVASFAWVLDEARAGDFVYFDPPYAPVSDTADFTTYARGGFGREDQRRLADVFAELTRRGVQAMLSNSDVPWLRRLYAGHRIERARASRSINSDPSRRGKVSELIVRNYA